MWRHRTTWLTEFRSNSSGKLTHAAHQSSHHAPRDEPFGNAHRTPSPGSPFSVAEGPHMTRGPFGHVAFLEARLGGARRLQWFCPHACRCFLNSGGRPISRRPVRESGGSLPAEF